MRRINSGLVESSRIDEALAQPVASARTRHDEIHFAEVGDLAVVDVSDELIGEEIADCQDRRAASRILPA